jgi:hypothetical protein
MIRALACLRRQIRSGMSSSRQNLAVDIAASVRITSRSSKSPTGPPRAFSRPTAPRAPSPSAWVNSTTSASSCSSRLDGPDRPATSAVLQASMNSAFHRPIDCSDTFSFRTASAIDISPAKDRQHDPGLLLRRDQSTHRLTSCSNADHALTTALPESLKRNTSTQKPMHVAHVRLPTICIERRRNQKVSVGR